MNKDDKASLSDPKSSELDYSMNNEISKEITENNTNEVRNINIKLDLKDTTASSINNEADKIKTDLVFETGNANNTSSEFGTMIVPKKAISCAIAKDSIADKYIFKQPCVPLRLAANTSNIPKQLTVRGITKTDGTFIPIKLNKQIHLNDKVMTGKKFMVNSKKDLYSLAIDKHKNKSILKVNNKRSIDDQSSLPNLRSLKLLKSSPRTNQMDHVQMSQLFANPYGFQYDWLLNTGVTKESLSSTKSKVIVGDQDVHMPRIGNQQPLLETESIANKDISNDASGIQEQLDGQIFSNIYSIRNIDDSSFISTNNNEIGILQKAKVEQQNKKLKHNNLASLSSTTVGTTIVSKPRILNNLTHLDRNLNIRKSNNNLNNKQQREQLTKNNQNTTTLTKTSLVPPMTNIIEKNLDDNIPMITTVHPNSLLNQKCIGVNDSIPTIEKIDDTSALSTTNNKIMIPGKANVEELNEKEFSSSTTLSRTIVSKPRINDDFDYLAFRPSLNIREYNNDLNIEQQKEHLTKNYQNTTAGISSLNKPLNVSNIKILPKNLISKSSQNLYSLIKKNLYGISNLNSLSLSPDKNDRIKGKHCKCSKSQCLQMYCTCFADGEFCKNCVCKNCSNNFDAENERQKAIGKCLRRNPHAFKPKITKAIHQSDLLFHNIGCKCQKSRCEKNYCECFFGNILCSSNCKCIECHNKKKPDNDLSIIDITKIENGPNNDIGTEKSFDEKNEIIEINNSVSNESEEVVHPHKFITQDVIDATVNCMIAQAEQCEKNGFTGKTAQQMILEEFGRCLSVIVDSSTNNNSEQ